MGLIGLMKAALTVALALKSVQLMPLVRREGVM